MKELTIPEIDKGLKELATIEGTPLANFFTWVPRDKELMNKSSTAIIKIDSMEWCTRDRDRTRTKKKVDAFFSRIFATIQDIRNTPDTPSQKLKMGLHSGKLLKSLTQENYSKTIALSTIKDAFEVLKSSGILEQR